MNIDKFIKAYKETNNKEVFWKKHLKTKYVDVLTKQIYAKNIVRTCNHIVIDKDREVYKSNSLNTYIFFTMKLVELYTDIDFPEKDVNISEMYDKLNEPGIIDEFLKVLPPREYSEFKTILNMENDDLYKNEYSVSALLYSIKETLSMSSEVFSKVLDDTDFSTLTK